jgi:hypothetical protein
MCSHDIPFSDKPVWDEIKDVLKERKKKDDKKQYLQNK